jgi:TDG/mug DNA glycosylase family protein
MTILPDVLAPGLAVIFCGTAVSTVSALRGAYYAGPGNAFWPTLFKVGLTPRLFAPAEYRGIKRYSLGLTDLVKTISGADVALSGKQFDSDRLRKVILKYRPLVLAFTSKRAAQEFVGHSVGYGVLPEKVGETILFVLPSPSGAARRYWSDGPWRELAQLRFAAKLSGVGEPRLAADAPQASHNRRKKSV